jgi:hypothetical protein
MSTSETATHLPQEAPEAFAQGIVDVGGAR